MRGLAARGSAHTCLVPAGRSTACLHASRRRGLPYKHPYIYIALDLGGLPAGALQLHPSLAPRAVVPAALCGKRSGLMGLYLSGRLC